MKIKFLNLTYKLALFLLLGLTSAAAQTVPEKLDLYLLIGQSNMAGRGKVDELSKSRSPDIWVINKQNEWQPAADPLHYDKPAAVGVGPGLAFAEEILRTNPSRPIGLIPCAVGGSGIDDWQPGRKHAQTGIYAYDEMLLRVKEAQKHGKIKAILWHQGEGDSSLEKKLVYEEKLEAFFERLRKETKTKKVPILIGTLGDFYAGPHKPHAQTINEIITNFPATHKNTYLVSAAGLKDLGDHTHFDTASARELGKRYAQVLLKITKK